uniref:Uncharacterized protein n=1 Tax=Lutzomyia longipalpis TaxID=7200 RepID=A0A1B0C977_LUTLO
RPICTGGYGGSSCTTTIVAPVTLKCPAGFALSNNQCISSTVRTITAEKLIGCSSGYTMQNNQCVRTTSSQTTASYVCPEGYTLSGNLCYPPQGPVLPPTPPILPPPPPPSVPQQICPTGYTFNGATCVQNIPQCPTGYQFSGGMCHPVCQTQTGGWNYGQTVNPPCAYPNAVSYIGVQRNNPCLTNPVPSIPVQSFPVQSFPVQSFPVQPVQPCGPPVPPYVPPVPPYVPPVQPIIPPVQPIIPPVQPIVPPVQPIPETPPVQPLPPISPTLKCPPEYELIDGLCKDKLIQVERPIEQCPMGFILINNECRKDIVDVIKSPVELGCPEGTTYTPEGCVRQTCVNQNQNQTCVYPTFPTYPHTNEHFSSSNPLSNSINNHNPINVTSNVNANSTNHVIVHLYTQEGETRVVTGTDGKHTETVIPQPPKPTPPVEPRPPVHEEDKCCTIVSPRICKPQQDSSWRCFHRRKQVCSPMCDRQVMYLRPPRPVYQPPVMVVPPMRTRPCNHCSYRTMHDCSGCQMKRGYCPQYCSSYQCSSASECGYMNQDSYCNEYGGEMCSSDYGCLEGEYCDY